MCSRHWSFFRLLSFISVCTFLAWCFSISFALTFQVGHDFWNVKGNHLFWFCLIRRLIIIFNVDFWILVSEFGFLMVCFAMALSFLQIKDLVFVLLLIWIGLSLQNLAEVKIEGFLIAVRSGHKLIRYQSIKINQSADQTILGCKPLWMLFPGFAGSLWLAAQKQNSMGLPSVSEFSLLIDWIRWLRRYYWSNGERMILSEISGESVICLLSHTVFENDVSEWCRFSFERMNMSFSNRNHQDFLLILNEYINMLKTVGRLRMIVCCPVNDHWISIIRQLKTGLPKGKA